MLEVLVHLEVDSIPPPFQLMRIQVPDGLPHSAWPNSARSDLSSETAEWGDAWLARGDTALARVPSAIAPDSFNWLITPLHSAARQIATTAASRWPWDDRLFRGRPGQSGRPVRRENVENTQDTTAAAQISRYAPPTPCAPGRPRHPSADSGCPV